MYLWLGKRLCSSRRFIFSNDRPRHFLETGDFDPIMIAPFYDNRVIFRVLNELLLFKISLVSCLGCVYLFSHVSESNVFNRIALLLFCF